MIYGHGELFHFIKFNEFILGMPIVIFSVVGIFGFFIKRIKNKPLSNKTSAEEMILMLGCFAVYLIAHSIFWWKGIFGSDGLIRVMAGITPLIALLSLRGANLILSFRNTIFLKCLLIGVVIWMPFKQDSYPRPFTKEELVIHEACDWIREHKLTSSQIVYAHPFVVYDLNKDPFDKQSVSDWYVLNKSVQGKGIETGELVLWDSHFCPVEGGMPIQTFLEDSNFKLLKSFSSGQDNKAVFEVYVFQRL